MTSILQAMTDAVRKGLLHTGKGAGRIHAFLAARQNPDGAFQGRHGQSDLYYTSFGADILSHMPSQDATGAVEQYILSQNEGLGLGFMDLVSLARTRMRLLPRHTTEAWRLSVAGAIRRYECPQGGFDTKPASMTPSVTATFMAWTALEALDCLPSSPQPILSALMSLENRDGSFANHPSVQAGNTIATAAAIVLRLCLAGQTSPAAVEWLIGRCFCDGGFLAFPEAPIPDLLSTSSALFGLRLHGSGLDDIASDCRSFVAGLHDNQGGYKGHALDSVPDVEYTYYAMLALGSLPAPLKGLS